MPKYLARETNLVSAVQFTKGMNEAQVLETITETFCGKLWDVDFEIFMSVHSALVVPTLGQNESGIDRIILNRLFKEKPVYLQPNKHILSDPF